MASLPSLVVFDLDACCWYPEMYMIRRGSPDVVCVSSVHWQTLLQRQEHAVFHSTSLAGAPFSATADPTVLKTAGGQAVRLLGNVANIWKASGPTVSCNGMQGCQPIILSLQEVHRSPAFANTRVGVASRCDEPDWGRECLRKFMVEALVLGLSDCFAVRISAQSRESEVCLGICQLLVADCDPATILSKVQVQRLHVDMRVWQRFRMVSPCGTWLRAAISWKSPSAAARLSCGLLD